MQPTLDSFEIIPDRPLQTNGVPRSGWTRTRPASTWHRVYLVALVILDFGASLLANQISVSLFRQKAGFDLINADFLLLVTLVLLPAAWVIVLWSHGAYDRRYLGVGTDEFKRVVRASWTIVAVVAFLAFAYKRDVSRMSVGVALLGGLICILAVRFMARSVLHLLRQRFGVATMDGAGARAAATSVTARRSVAVGLSDRAGCSSSLRRCPRASPRRARGTRRAR